MTNEELAGMDELVGRLRATYVRSVYAPASGTGTPITRSPLLKEELLINPTGPEAADMIQSLAAQLADARAENARLTLTVRKLQGNQAALEAALEQGEVK